MTRPRLAHKPSKTLSSILLAGAGVGLALYLLSCVGLRLSWSGSVPRGLYLAVDQPLDRGTLVVACLPEDIGRWAAGRGYISRGVCSGDLSPVGKPVVGLPGDLVEVRPSGISINGIRLRHSKRADSDSQARPMPWASFGRYRLGAKEIWLYSEHHRRSLDSRVYGPVLLDDVEEVLVPLWVEDSR